MRRHTIIGERILMAAPALRPVASLVRSSHERWDGNGYPDGLGGEDIPLGARIVAVCDAFDAMITDRPYRPRDRREARRARSCAAARARSSTRAWWTRSAVRASWSRRARLRPCEAAPVGGRLVFAEHLPGLAVAPAIGSSVPPDSTSPAAAAASIAASRSGVSSPAFSSSIFSSHSAPSAAFCSSTTTEPAARDLSISAKRASPAGPEAPSGAASRGQRSGPRSWRR